MTFEEKLKKLETISELMKNQDTPLEESVSSFEEGMKLAKELEKELKSFEQRVEILTKEDEEGPHFEELK